ncbi:MAG: hypothetical protein HYX68_12985 [Planctomycetes bacterium]|nr:hypothetical protein [Planctomycetota bacterium]
MRLSFWSASALILVGLAAWSTPAQTAKKKHPHHHLHHALWELRDARAALVKSSKKLAGGKKRAVSAIDDAIRHLELILQYKGDNIKGVPTRGDLAVAYKKYKSHPHLHHAVHELRHVQKHLQAASHNFNGHRKAALSASNHAIAEIEALLKPNVKKKKKN